MRKRFELQYEIGAISIERINIPTKSRDELPPVLRALQHIYMTPELNKKVFDLLESKIKLVKKGRPGLTLWEILVLGSVRLTLACNFDRLEHTANFDTLVRELLGISIFGGNGKNYPLQTLKDNVTLLDETTLDEINELVVKEGHALKKKENGEPLQVKIDSYVLESNVHFPTDINLLWDASRKLLDFIRDITEDTQVSGWRNHKQWRRDIKNTYIKLNRVAFRGGAHKEERLLKAALDYIKITESFSFKLKQTKKDLHKAADCSLVKKIKMMQIDEFEKMLDKHIDLVERRLIKGEHIPHEEKVFSLFEPWTEWIQKGKAGNRVELGLRLAVCSDQYGFILHKRVMEKEQDVDVAVELAKTVIDKYGSIASISYDKGFWSKTNFQEISNNISQAIMPKKGKLNQTELERESDRGFRQLRNKHSAIESDINALEHHGLDRCPDRGIKHFRTYAALGILAFNLHRLGNFLLEKDRREHEALKRCERKAA